MFFDFNVKTASDHLRDILAAIEVKNSTATFLFVEFQESIRRSVLHAQYEPGCEALPEVMRLTDKASGELYAGNAEAAKQYVNMALAEFEKVRE